MKRLSPMELDILQKLSEGYLVKQIGNSRWTVLTHMRHIKEKLEAETNCQCVAKALREGLIK